MTPEQIVKACRAIAEGHWRRGITPQMHAWDADYEALVKALASIVVMPNLRQPLE